MPAPPPPPPMAPAAPPPPIFKAPKGGADERDALLKSIRKGAKLKKAVTNDRSAPSLGGSSSNNSSSSNNRNINNNDNVSNSMVSPMKNFSSIQMELKKQLANDSRNRGPPPPAPNRNLSDTNFPRQPFSLKETSPNGIHLSQLSLNSPSTLHANPSTLHRKAKSNANLSMLESGIDVNGFQSNKPVINHGKPNLAPKPPVFNGKPSPLTPRPSSAAPRPALSRAQSMKSAPRTPEPQSPIDTINTAVKFGTVRHMSNVLGQSLSLGGQPQGVKQRPALNGRPTAPPPKVPQQPPSSAVHLTSPSQQPPPLPSTPPPPSKVSVKHPSHAPPPPPPLATLPQPPLNALLPQPPPHAPPPPPHKTGSQHQRQPPPMIPLPINNNNNASNPPPPPPRHSSMRETSSVSNIAVNLDEKFKHMFHTPDEFPQPPAYRNVLKVYNYKPAQKPGYVV